MCSWPGHLSWPIQFVCGMPMLAAGAEMVLLDGAVDRKSPALPQLADGVVLSGRLF